MTLLDRIKADSLVARKARSPIAGTLVTLLGEISTKEKTFNPARDITDAEIVAIIRKFINGMDETLVALRARLQTRHDDVEKVLAEKAALEAYLPQQMTEGDIETFVRAQVAAGSAKMGDIMAALKNEHGGQYDGKLASSVVKRVLA